MLPASSATTLVDSLPGLRLRAAARDVGIRAYEPRSMWPAALADALSQRIRRMEGAEWVGAEPTPTPTLQQAEARQYILDGPFSKAVAAQRANVQSLVASEAREMAAIQVDPTWQVPERDPRRVDHRSHVLERVKASMNAGARYRERLQQAVNGANQRHRALVGLDRK